MLILLVSSEHLETKPENFDSISSVLKSILTLVPTRHSISLSMQHLSSTSTTMPLASGLASCTSSPFIIAFSYASSSVSPAARHSAASLPAAKIAVWPHPRSTASTTARAAARWAGTWWPAAFASSIASISSSMARSSMGYRDSHFCSISCSSLASFLLRASSSLTSLLSSAACCCFFSLPSFSLALSCSFSSRSRARFVFCDSFFG
mmetsp:Transcript_99203/g.159948  ORF Transcript_99203/g.159948 Transcript_99203/m.159948 type:complete len:207 (+) Transcript_99203:2456-3076(+)